MEKFSKNKKYQAVDNAHVIRVLIVEDHPLSAHIAERFLTDLGCQVEWAHDATTALEYFKNDNDIYHLILLDVSLPDEDGYTLAHKIRATRAFQNALKQKRSPYIFALTARYGAENRERCLAVGMSGVLLKPLLKTTAREILGRCFPEWVEAHPDQKSKSGILNGLVVVGEPINFNEALTIHDGDIDFIKSALRVLLDNLLIELQRLQSACIAQNWDAGRVIIHKLKGGTCYFGLERLDQVCECFSKVLRENPKEHWDKIYNILVSEVEKVRLVYTQWLKDLLLSE
jgi:two-component system, NarL family, sensor histidine kinase BarA